MSRAGCILPLLLQGKEGIARHRPGLCVGLQPLLCLLPLSHCFQYSLREIWYLICIGRFPVVNRDQLSAAMQQPALQQLLWNVCKLIYPSRSAWPVATLDSGLSPFTQESSAHTAGQTKQVSGLMTGINNMRATSSQTSEAS